MRPHTSLIVCTTPRSGSGLLCDVLWNTELAGRPDEWFGYGTERHYAARWGTASFPEYFERVLEAGTTQNGVFGVKIHSGHLERFNKLVPSARSQAGLKPGDSFGRVFPGVCHVWLRRRDTLRQAVSQLVAAQRKSFSWRGGSRPRPPLRYDRELITRIIGELDAHDEAWKVYFRRCAIAPLCLFYEDDLEGGYEGAVRRVIDLLGVAIPTEQVFRTDYRKQADEASEALVRRYQQEV